MSNFDVVLITDTGVRTVGLDHPFYVEICRALKEGKDDEVLGFVDAKHKIAEKFEKISTDVTVTEAPTEKGYDVTIDGMKITGRIAELITNFKKLNLPFKALVNFWKKLQKNPNDTGRESMIAFLSANNVPLLPNGNFLAYKGVFRTEDSKKFTASHDRSFVYTLGQPATLERENCTVDIHNACGPGLHVGGFDHANTYGDTIIDCEVDPADVVSVPTAEQCKLRACKLLPIRVNVDRKCYAESYIDLASGTICEGAKPPAEVVRANKKKKESKKTTWYLLKGNRLLVQRKVKKPGDEWSNTKPAAPVKGKKAPAVPRGAVGMRTWYRLNRDGEVVRKRAIEKPAGFSSHKPK